MRHNFFVCTMVGLLTGSAVVGLALANHAQTVSPQDHNLHHTPDRSAPMSQPMGMKQVDQHFIEMMISHHQNAVKIAELALTQAKRPEIKKMAAAIKQDQTREIQQMQRWYKQWFGKEVPQKMGMGMMGSPGCMMGRGQSMMAMHSGMQPMHMDLQALKNSTDFDREFVRQMVPHHQMAVMMAGMLQRRTDRPEMQKLATDMIQSQTAEINQMQQWYQVWQR